MLSKEKWKDLPKGGQRRGGKQEFKHTSVCSKAYALSTTSLRRLKHRAQGTPRKDAGNYSSAQLNQMKQQNEKAVPTTRFVSFWIAYKSLDGSAKVRDFTFSSQNLYIVTELWASRVPITF